MLSVMRKNAGSWLIKIILGLIIVVFVLWGVGNFGDEGGGRVATVDGESITFDEYRQTYDRMLEQVRARFGESLDDNLLKVLNLRQQAINQLIDQKVMLRAAKEMRLSVSEKELVDSIRNIDAFQSSGVFDQRRYEGVLGQIRMSPEAFETAQREMLLLEKLRRIIVGGVKVADHEAWEWYRWSNASVDLDYLFLDPDEFQDVVIAKGELEEYFEKNKQRYFTEPQVRVRYVRFMADDYAARVKITDSEIDDYYRSHSDEFRTEKQVEARHILLKLDPEAEPGVVADVRNKAMEISEKAKAGGDFAELARQYSEGPSAAGGGYLGAFGKAEMVGPFSDAAFGMKPGEISEPVRTRFGWHIIKVESVTEAEEKSLFEASPDIRRKLTREIAVSMAHDDATTVLDSALSAPDLAQAAEKAGFSVQETMWFTPEGPDEIIQNPVAFAEAAFALEKDDISDLIDLGAGYAILQVQEKQEPKAPALAAVQEMVLSELMAQKRRDTARETGNRLLDELRGGKEMETVASETGRSVRTTGFFKRGEPIPDIGYERELIDAAFLLSREHAFSEKPLEGENGFYLVRFRERRDPLQQDFEKERVKITQDLVNQKRIQFFNEWLAERKKQSEIEIREEILG